MRKGDTHWIIFNLSKGLTTVRLAAPAIPPAIKELVISGLKNLVVDLGSGDDGRAGSGTGGGAGEGNASASSCVTAVDEEASVDDAADDEEASDAGTGEEDEEAREDRPAVDEGVDVIVRIQAI